MKKKWMYLIAEMAAMIILSLIRSWQNRDQQLPRGGKVRKLKGLPVVGFGWFKRNSVPQAAARAGGRHTKLEDAAPGGTEPIWTPPVDPKKSA